LISDITRFTWALSISNSTVFGCSHTSISINGKAAQLRALTRAMSSQAFQPCHPRVARSRPKP
jgi:hypothetical protein